MAKKKLDYLDGLYEVASQIKDARAAVMEPAPDKSTVDVEVEIELPSSSPTPSITREEAATPVKMTPVESTRVTPTGVSPSPNRMDIKSNFIKVDMNILDTLLPTLDSSAQAVYLRLYRLSWGFRQCTCAVTIPNLCKACNLSSRTVQRAIDRLAELGYIEHEINKQPGVGNLYRIYLPHEIPALSESIDRVPDIKETEVKENDKKTPVNSTPVDSTPVKTTPVNLTKTPVNSTPVDSTPVEKTGCLTGTSETPVNSTPVDLTPIIDIACTDNNNRHKVAVVDEFLKSQGLSVPTSRILKWISDGITLNRIREAVFDVKTWADNPTGALIDTIESGREVGPAAVETIATLDVAEKQAVEEARQKEEQERWLTSEITRIGPEGMAKIRKEALAECKGNWVYEKAKTEEVRERIVEGKMREILLAHYK